MDMETWRYEDIKRKTEAQTSFMHGNAEYTFSKYMQLGQQQHGHAAGTYSMNMQHGDVDMKHGRQLGTWYILQNLKH
jgi:DNA-binding MltR family transcriptional regulator